MTCFREPRLLGMLEAAEAAIERLEACVPAGELAPRDRELLDAAMYDVLRAVVHIRRRGRDVELAAIAALDRAAAALHTELSGEQLGRTRSVG